MGESDTRRRETKDCGLLRDDYRPLGRLFKIIQMCTPWAIPCISSSVCIRLTFSFSLLLIIYNLFNNFFFFFLCDDFNCLLHHLFESFSDMVKLVVSVLTGCGHANQRSLLTAYHE